MGWHAQIRRLVKATPFVGVVFLCCAQQALAQQTVFPGDRTRNGNVVLRGTTAGTPVQQPESPGSVERTATSNRQNNQLTNFDRTATAQPSGDANSASSAPAPANAATPTDLGPADTLRSLDPDTRSQRDKNAFQDPPVGHNAEAFNPRAFRIESINPLRDRRTRQFFENEPEPFAHLGMRLGPFILFQELEIGAAWNSNVLLEANARSDWLADLKSETRLVSNWARHALELRMQHDRSYYRSFPSENERGQTYQLRGRLDVTSRTNVEAAVSRRIQQESRSSVDNNAGLTGDRSDVITDRVEGAVNHRFNRLSLQLRGSQEETRYDDIASEDRDVRTRSVALRSQWEFRPTFSVFGEVELNDRDHKSVASSDNISRNSTGERYRAGVAMGQTGEFLRGEASVGYGIQRTDARQLPDVEAFLVDANVAWRITPLTSVLFEASTGIDETTQTRSPGVINRQGGVTLRHSFTERLLGEAGVTYAVQDYQRATLRENTLTFRTNVEYTFNRHAALFTRYEHTRLRSTDGSRNYDASTFLIGARLRN